MLPETENLLPHEAVHPFSEGRSTDTLNLLESSDINLKSVSLFLSSMGSLSCLFDNRVKNYFSQP